MLVVPLIMHSDNDVNDDAVLSLLILKTENKADEKQSLISVIGIPSESSASRVANRDHEKVSLMGLSRIARRVSCSIFKK